MLRTIILMRHAKSNWAVPLQPDFDRELTERGIANATTMGERLLKNNIQVEAICSSSAVRALQTANLVNAIIKQSNVQYFSELYHASPDSINEVIYSLDDSLQTVLIVCHNPGITHWANMHCGFVSNDMPTASMVAFSFTDAHWHNFDLAKKRLLFFDWPKKGL